MSGTLQQVNIPYICAISMNSSFSFRWQERLHRDRDFQKVMKEGRRLVHPALFIFVCPRNDGRKLRRLGLVTSRKVGIAVERNRVKRLLREVFRLNKHLLTPGVDVVFVLRRGAVGLSFETLRAAVCAQWRTAGLLTEKTSADSTEQEHA
jgi:ribonuclease P protein component